MGGRFGLLAGDHYQMFRKPEVIPASFCDLSLHIPDMEALLEKGPEGPSR